MNYEHSRACEERLTVDDPGIVVRRGTRAGNPVVVHRPVREQTLPFGLPKLRRRIRQDLRHPTQT